MTPYRIGREILGAENPLIKTYGISTVTLQAMHRALGYSLRYIGQGSFGSFRNNDSCQSMRVVARRESKVLPQLDLRSQNKIWMEDMRPCVLSSCLILRIGRKFLLSLTITNLNLTMVVVSITAPPQVDCRWILILSQETIRLTWQCGCVSYTCVYSKSERCSVHHRWLWVNPKSSAFHRIWGVSRRYASDLVSIELSLDYIVSKSNVVV